MDGPRAGDHQEFWEQRPPTRARRPPPPTSGGRRPLVPIAAAVGAIGLIVAAATALGGGDSPRAVSTTTTRVTAPPPTKAPTTTTKPKPKTRLTATLKRGSTGPEVSRLQARLFALGFMPGGTGKPTGTFGPLTEAAVWAFNKLVMGAPATTVTGAVSNATWQRMQDDNLVRPRRTETTATHLEIYLDRQVAVVFRGTRPVFISHISSGQVDKNGNPALYREWATYDTDRYGNKLAAPVEKPIMAYSKTPPGVFLVERKVTGKRVGPLGGMLNPVYFNKGIAIHGGANVPRTRESHGCVRVPNDISHHLIRLLTPGDAVFVWDGKLEPEDQSAAAMEPSWDRIDPSVTTTTTSTTSTTLVPSSTVPASVKPGASTTRPPTKAVTTTTIRKRTATATTVRRRPATTTTVAKRG